MILFGSAYTKKMADKSGVAVTSAYQSSRSPSSSDLSENADVKKGLGNESSSEGELIDPFKPIPEYEGAHRYDPKAEWTEQEEKVLVRKVCD